MDKDVKEFGEFLENFFSPINYEDEQVKICGTKNNVGIQFKDETLTPKVLREVVTRISKINDRFLYLEPSYFLDKKLGQLHSVRNFCYIHDGKLYLEHAIIDLETGNLEYYTNILVYKPDQNIKILATKDFLLVNDKISENTFGDISRIEVVNETSFLFSVKTTRETIFYIGIIKNNNLKIRQIDEIYPNHSDPFILKGYPYTIISVRNDSSSLMSEILTVLNMKTGKVVGKYCVDTQLRYESTIVEQTKNKIMIQSSKYNVILLDLKTGKSEILLASDGVFIKQGKLHLYKKNKFVEISDIILERVNILGQEDESLTYVIGSNGRKRFLFIVDTKTGKCTTIKFKKGRRVAFYTKYYYVLECLDGITRIIEKDSGKVIGCKEFKNGQVVVIKGACGQVSIEGPNFLAKGYNFTPRIFENYYC